ncbi:MAG TPA: ribosome maturation factor RimM [Pyrinomonadaceae bacterium]|jgi:16S rRNA processing protein RimM|nr:ribosome maturation factor RimM [Pyrinomonadaceae bacterium]
MLELVAIARIAKPRGLRGELAADVLTDFPERFKGLERVTAVLPTGERLDLKIRESWFQKNRIVLKFEGYDSIDAAEMLRGAEVCIPESEAVELEEGEFFDWELVDCQVETVNGEYIGKVREVMRTGGTEILIVTNEEKEFLVPFAETICFEVDVEKKLIRVDPPEGLLDF